MNNEPVAWIWSEDGCNMGVCLDQDKQIGKQEFQDYSIPLYTHPVKEYFEDEPQAEELHEILQSNANPVKEQLTDAEMSIVCFALHRLIHSAYAKASEAGQDLGNKYSKIGDVAKFLKDVKTAESALAILKKAQE